MKTKHVTIVGAGPAGCTVGILLRKAGHEVTIIDRGVRPRLIVGESLIPAVTVQLRALGLEERVAEIGRHKPGAAIAAKDDFDWSLLFEDFNAILPTYAYNVPRAQFDALFVERAAEVGCVIRRERAIFASDDGEHLKLSKPSDVPPHDFIVDATGRARLGAAALGIGAKRGGRDDAAIFSHFDRADLPYGGAVHMTVFNDGWSWRIPLRDRVSVGFVVNSTALDKYGATDAERLTKLVATVPILSEALQGATQLEEVFRYQNYQLTSDRMVGANWAMVGDAAGFIDPVFSSGLALGLDGAFRLAEAIIAGSDGALLDYEEDYRDTLAAWQGVVDTFYNGRFFGLIRGGNALQRTNPELLKRWQPDRRSAAILSGHCIKDPVALDRFYNLMTITEAHPEILAPDAVV